MDVVSYVYKVTLKTGCGSFGNVIGTPDNTPELIRTLREARGWSMKQLEQRAGIANGLVSKIENGRGKATTWQIMLRLFDTLGVDVNITFRKEPTTDGT